MNVQDNDFASEAISQRSDACPVMPALVAGIRVLLCGSASKTWMAGTSPAMTISAYALIPNSRAAVSPSIPARSASLRPGVPRMWSTEVCVQGNG